jgi:hypothetical protein
VCVRTEDLVMVVHPRDGHGKILAMLEGYLDESGIHDGAPVCVVAGYFGGPGQWKKFDVLWRRVLNEFDVPDFHAKDFWHRTPEGGRKKPYVGWTDRDDERFLADLTKAIQKYKIHPFSPAIYPDDFNRFSLNERRYLTGAQLRNGRFQTSGCPTQPYFVPFQNAVLTVASYATAGSLAHFYLGLGRNLSGYAEVFFDQIKAHPDMPHRDKMGIISFPPASETPHIQAADLLSYLTYQYVIAMRANDSEKPGKWLRQCLLGLRNLEDFPIYDHEVLKKLLDRAPGLPAD